jgi:spermidine synthase
MQPMSIVVFLSAIAFYPLFSSLYYYLLLNTGEYHLALNHVLWAFGPGIYLGTWFSQRYKQAADKKFITFLGTTLIFSISLLLFFKTQDQDIIARNIYFFIGTLFFIFGITCTLLFSCVKNWAYYAFWGLLIGIFFKENFLIDTFGYPGILLTGAFLYLGITLVLWLFRKNISLDYMFETEPASPEWHTRSWFFITLLVQFFILCSFWNTERLTAISLNDSELTHTLFLLMAILNLGIGARYGHYVNNGKHEKKTVYRNLILFGILLFLVLINNKTLVSFPHHFTYNNSVRSQHGFILINLLSTFLITLPFAPAGQLLLILYRIGFYRFMSALFISLTIGATIYYGIVLPYLGVTNSFFYIIYLCLALGVLMYCKMDGAQTSRYYTVLYLFLAILIVNHIYKNPVLLNHTSTATAFQEQRSRYRIDNLDPQMSLDGPIDSVQLLKNNESDSFYLVGNGNIVATWNEHHATKHEIVSVLMPLLAAMHEKNPHKALVLGLKEGLVTQTLLNIPSISKINTIENDPSYIQIASQLYYYPDIFENARSHLHAEDFRFYLKNISKYYDLVILNTENYWKKNEARFYTQEFYSLAKEHLSPNGIFAQTLNLNNLPAITFNTLLKTIASVFPYNSLYLVTNTDLIVLSSREPIKIQNEKLLQNKEIKDQLKRIDIHSLNDIQARFFGNSDLINLYLKTFTFGGKEDNLFFDYFPFIENESERALRTSPENALFLVKWGIFPPLDYLTGDAVQAPTQITASKFSNIASRYNHAEAIYRYIQGGSSDDAGLSEEMQNNLSTLEVSDPAHCKDLTARHIWLNAYLYLIEHTLPYLSNDKMKVIVNKMRQHPCNNFYAEKPDVVLNWIKLHEALLSKNYEAVLSLAKQLYNKDRNNMNTQIAVSYILLAQIKLKHFAEAEKTWIAFPFKYMASDLSRMLVTYAVMHKN